MTHLPRDYHIRIHPFAIACRIFHHRQQTFHTGAHPRMAIQALQLEKLDAIQQSSSR